MLLSQDITIAPKIAQETPQVNILHILPGTVASLIVLFRYGSGNLCGVRIHHAEIQRWPYIPGEWIPSSAYLYEFAEDLVIDQEPFDLRIETYNLDDTFEHHVWIAVVVRNVIDNENVRWLKEQLEIA